jgi:outer membrane protein TolC
MKECIYRACYVLLLGIAGIATVWGQAPAVESAPQLLTLDEAVRIAEANNREVQSSELDVTKAGQVVAQARTNYRPKLDAYALGGVPFGPIKFTIPAGTLGTYAATGPIPSTNATIRSPMQLSGFIYATATQPLTQLYKINLAVQQARLGPDLARQEVRAQQQETRRQVKEAYYQLAQLQPQVESAEVAVQYLTELSRLTLRRVSVETALTSDLLTVKATLKQQQYQLRVLQDSVTLQKQNLNHLLGRELYTRFSVEGEPTPDDAELSLETARKQALAQRPEVLEARLQIRSAQLDVRRERAEYIPNISLQVGYLSFQNLKFLPQNTGYTGLMMQWQPFDWGYKKHRIAELSSASRQKSIVEQDTEQRVLLDVEDNFLKLGQARMLLEARAGAREAERAKLHEATDRYKQQAVLVSGVLQQKSELSQAEAQYQQALENFWTTRAAFEKAIGAD